MLHDECVVVCFYCQQARDLHNTRQEDGLLCAEITVGLPSASGICGYGAQVSSTGRKLLGCGFIAVSVHVTNASNLQMHVLCFETFVILGGSLVVFPLVFCRVSVFL